MDLAVDRPALSGHAPDWGQVETVCLDMDGTLLDLRFDNFFWLEAVPQRYGAMHGISAEAALERLTPRLDAWRGTLQWYCVEHWTEELGLDVTALKFELREHIRYLPGAAEFLGRLAGLGKRRVLTTNAHPKSLAVKNEQTGIGRHFDTVVSAHDIGAPKESPEFWSRFAARHAIDPATTLFVDDSPPVLRAALRAGVRWIYQALQPDSTQPPREPLPGVPGIRVLRELG